MIIIVIIMMPTEVADFADDGQARSAAYFINM